MPTIGAPDVCRLCGPVAPPLGNNCSQYGMLVNRRPFLIRIQFRYWGAHGRSQIS